MLQIGNTLKDYQKKHSWKICSQRFIEFFFLENMLAILRIWDFITINYPLILLSIKVYKCTLQPAACMENGLKGLKGCCHWELKCCILLWCPLGSCWLPFLNLCLFNSENSVKEHNIDCIDQIAFFRFSILKLLTSTTQSSAFVH